MNEHDRVQQLLPWYVNGSLDELDMLLVGSHVEACSECGAEIAMLVAHMQAFNAAADPPLNAFAGDRGFAALAARISAGDLQNRRRWPPEMGPARLLTLAAALLITVTLGILWLTPAPYSIPDAQSPASFEAMTTPLVQDGIVVQLIFHPQTAERDIRHLLVDLEGELLGSPSVTGVYRIRLPKPVNAVQLVAGLRENPVVRWAEIER